MNRYRIPRISQKRSKTQPILTDVPMLGKAVIENQNKKSDEPTEKLSRKEKVHIGYVNFEENNNVSSSNRCRATGPIETYRNRKKSKLKSKKNLRTSTASPKGMNPIEYPEEEHVSSLSCVSSASLNFNKITKNDKNIEFSDSVERINHNENGDQSANYTWDIDNMNGDSVEVVLIENDDTQFVEIFNGSDQEETVIWQVVDEVSPENAENCDNHSPQIFYGNQEYHDEYENAIQEDLELGAMETVCSATDEAENKALKVLMTIAVPTEKRKRKQPRQAPLATLLNSVLDKTLLVVLKKCDGHPLMPENRSRAPRASTITEVKPIELESCSKPFANKVETKKAKGRRTRQTRRKSKRKENEKKKEKGCEWDIITETKTFEATQIPLKLKIKRRLASTLSMRENKIPKITDVNDVNGSGGLSPNDFWDQYDFDYSAISENANYDLEPATPASVDEGSEYSANGAEITELNEPMQTRSSKKFSMTDIASNRLPANEVNPAIAKLIAFDRILSANSSERTNKKDEEIEVNQLKKSCAETIVDTICTVPSTETETKVDNICTIPSTEMETNSDTICTVSSTETKLDATCIVPSTEKETKLDAICTVPSTESQFVDDSRKSLRRSDSGFSETSISRSPGIILDLANPSDSNFLTSQASIVDNSLYKDDVSTNTHKTNKNNVLQPIDDDDDGIPESNCNLKAHPEANASNLPKSDDNDKEPVQNPESDALLDKFKSQIPENTIDERNSAEAEWISDQASDVMFLMDIATTLVSNTGKVDYRNSEICSEHAKEFTVKTPEKIKINSKNKEINDKIQTQTKAQKSTLGSLKTDADDKAKDTWTLCASNKTTKNDTFPQPDTWEVYQHKLKKATALITTFSESSNHNDNVSIQNAASAKPKDYFENKPIDDKYVSRKYCNLTSVPAVIKPKEPEPSNPIFITQTSYSSGKTTHVTSTLELPSSSIKVQQPIVLEKQVKAVNNSSSHSVSLAKSHIEEKSSETSVMSENKSALLSEKELPASSCIKVTSLHQPIISEKQVKALYNSSSDPTLVGDSNTEEKSLVQVNHPMSKRESDLLSKNEIPSSSIKIPVSQQPIISEKLEETVKNTLSDLTSIADSNMEVKSCVNSLTSEREGTLLSKNDLPSSSIKVTAFPQPIILEKQVKVVNNSLNDSVSIEESKMELPPSLIFLTSTKENKLLSKNDLPASSIDVTAFPQPIISEKQMEYLNNSLNDLISAMESNMSYENSLKSIKEGKVLPKNELLSSSINVTTLQQSIVSEKQVKTLNKSPNESVSVAESNIEVESSKNSLTSEKDNENFNNEFPSSSIEATSFQQAIISEKQEVGLKNSSSDSAPENISATQREPIVTETQEEALNNSLSDSAPVTESNIGIKSPENILATQREPIATEIQPLALNNSSSDSAPVADLNKEVKSPENILASDRGSELLSEDDLPALSVKVTTVQQSMVTETEVDALKKILSDSAPVLDSNMEVKSRVKSLKSTRKRKLLSKKKRSSSTKRSELQPIYSEIQVEALNNPSSDPAPVANLNTEVTSSENSVISKRKAKFLPKKKLPSASSKSIEFQQPIVSEIQVEALNNPSNDSISVTESNIKIKSFVKSVKSKRKRKLLSKKKLRSSNTNDTDFQQPIVLENRVEVLNNPSIDSAPVADSNTEVKSSENSLMPEKETKLLSKNITESTVEVPEPEVVIKQEPEELNNIDLNSSEGNYRCSTCGQQFEHAWGVRRHEKNHLPTRRSRYLESEFIDIDCPVLYEFEERRVPRKSNDAKNIKSMPLKHKTLTISKNQSSRNGNTDYKLNNSHKTGDPKPQSKKLSETQPKNNFTSKCDTSVPTTLKKGLLLRECSVLITDDVFKKQIQTAKSKPMPNLADTLQVNEDAVMGKEFMKSFTIPKLAENEANRSQSTNCPTLFEGFCKICGVECNFDSTKTYYRNNSLQKPYSCLTCESTFAKSEWEIHDKDCCLSEEFDIAEQYIQENLNELTSSKANYSIQKKRIFSCIQCFDIMSGII